MAAQNDQAYVALLAKFSDQVDDVVLVLAAVFNAPRRRAEK